MVRTGKRAMTERGNYLEEKGRSSEKRERSMQCEVIINARGFAQKHYVSLCAFASLPLCARNSWLEMMRGESGSKSALAVSVDSVAAEL